MAIAPNVVKERLKNLSVEELEAKYEEIKRTYCFASKEDQIGYIMHTYLNASRNTNNKSIKIALEELLKEKTGKDYTIEPKYFEITVTDIINYITHPNVDPFWTNTFSNFFNKLTDVDDNDKKKFLFELCQDKNSLNEFSKEIMPTQNPRETYDKYNEIAKQFVASHTFKG